MLSAEEMYEKCPQELKNWGIYVMVSIYQNADGKTPCMPDGLIPDIQIEDNPIQAYQIGDVNEPLLKQHSRKPDVHTKLTVYAAVVRLPHTSSTPACKNTTLWKTYPANSIIRFFTLQIMAQ